MGPQNTGVATKPKAVGYSKVDPLPVFAGDSTTEEPNMDVEETLSTGVTQHRDNREDPFPPRRDFESI